MDPDELLEQIDDDPYEDITREDMLQANRELIFDEDGEIVDEETFHSRLRDKGARVWEGEDGVMNFAEVPHEVSLCACQMMIEGGHEHGNSLEDYIPETDLLADEE